MRKLVQKHQANHRSPKLNLVQLESRDVPTVYQVEMLSAPEGIGGDTQAIHSGTLSAATTVEANSMVEALQKAVTGTIVVAFDGETSTYQFDVDSSAGDGTPFQVALENDVAMIEFEDQVGTVHCDWDFNDRTWVLSVTEVGDGLGGGLAAESLSEGGSANSGSGTGTIVKEETFDFQDGFAQGDEFNDVQVDVVVRTWGDSDTMQWDYTVTNTSADSPQSTDLFDLGMGIASFGFENVEGMVVVANTGGWTGILSANPDESGSVEWSGPSIPVGGSILLSVQTPLRPITVATGHVAAKHNDISNGYMNEESVAFGTICGPGKKPVVEIHDLNQVATTKIKVAQWEDAFRVVGGRTPEIKKKFPQFDKDRLFYYIEDAAANTNPNALDEVELTVKSGRKDASGVFQTRKSGVATLRETGNNTGVFHSRWLVAVSNEVDRQAVDTAYMGLTDGDTGLHTATAPPLVLLGDEVMGTYKDFEYKLASVPAKYTAAVQFYNIKDQAGNPVATADDIEHRKNEMRQAYAQVQVDFSFNEVISPGPIAGVDPTNGVQLFNWNNATNTATQTGLSNESMALIDRSRLRDANGAVTANDAKTIKVYFISSFQDSKFVNLQYRAYTFGPKVLEPLTIEDKYHNVVFWNRAHAGRFTLPHEVGHVFDLLHPSSPDDTKDAIYQTRLMYTPTSLQDAHDATKRLWDDEKVNIESKTPGLLTAQA